MLDHQSRVDAWTIVIGRTTSMPWELCRQWEGDITKCRWGKFVISPDIWPKVCWIENSVAPGWRHNPPPQNCLFVAQGQRHSHNSTSRNVRGKFSCLAQFSNHKDDCSHCQFSIVMIHDFCMTIFPLGPLLPRGTMYTLFMLCMAQDFKLQLWIDHLDLFLSIDTLKIRLHVFSFS